MALTGSLEAGSRHRARQFSGARQPARRALRRDRDAPCGGGRRHYGRAARADTDLGVDHAEAHPAEVARELVLKHPTAPSPTTKSPGTVQSSRPVARGHSGLPARHEAGDAMHGVAEIADFPTVAPDTPEADALRRSIARSRIEQFLASPMRPRSTRPSEGPRADLRRRHAEILPGIRLRDVNDGGSLRNAVHSCACGTDSARRASKGCA